MRLLYFLTALAMLAWASPASAHDFWAGTGGPGPDGRTTIFIGYGHGFPIGDDIGADEAGRYEAPKLFGPDGEISLSPGDGPTSRATARALDAGTYIAVVESKAAFGGRSPAGWVLKSKREDPTVTRCSYGGSFGKAVINVGGAGDGKAASRIVGHKLEIVPSLNPAAAKAGEPYPIKVIFDGKPLVGARVEAFFAGFTPDNSAIAFASATNQEGELDVIPLRPGQWLIKTSNSHPYADQSECDTERWGASLAITIAE
jgi:uncharacterized GH25 family protein